MTQNGTEYICELSPASLSKAKKELSEDPKERLGAVQTLREWILQQKHMTCNTETTWLLRILRASKFSQLKARTVITNYLSMKTLVPIWLEEHDFTHPRLKALYDTGTAFILPGRCPDGSAVLFHTMAFDPGSKDYDVHTLGAIVFGQMGHCLTDEDVQVNGIRLFVDVSGFSMKHQNFISIEMSKKFLKLMNGAFPMRMKGIHMYNHGPVMEAFTTLLRPFMSKKVNERFHLHGSSLDKLYKIFPKSILPAEYVPDGEEDQSAGTLQSLMDAQLKELTSQSVSEKLRRENSAVFKIDRSAIPFAEPQESFRKLTID